MSPFLILILVLLALALVLVFLVPVLVMHFIFQCVRWVRVKLGLTVPPAEGGKAQGGASHSDGRHAKSAAKKRPGKIFAKNENQYIDYEEVK